MGVTNKDRTILGDSVAVKIMVELKFYIPFWEDEIKICYVVGLDNIGIFLSHNCGDLDSLEILSCLVAQSCGFPGMN